MAPTFFASTPMRRRSIIVRLLLAALFLAAIVAALPVVDRPAGAQSPVSLTALSVDLWPEFDRPGMLVMYQFTLSPEFKSPGDVRLRIPAAAGSPNAVAVCEPSGNCFNTPFTQEPGGAWTTLIISATMPDVRVEYYDPGLQKDGTNRHFEFQWPGDYAVDSFRVHVQQPAGAVQMRLTPGSATQSVENDGLTYYTLDVGAVPAGQTVAIEVDYVKEVDTLSVTGLPVQPIEPLNTQTGQLAISSSAPWVLGGVGVALILGGGLWYWYSGRRRGAPMDARRRTRRKASPPAAAAESEAPGPVYCHQCGNRASASDRFCRTCGAPLRRQ